MATHVVSCLRSAPLTFLWLAVLLATTIAQHLMSPADLDRVLGARSTNLEHLTHDPIHVLWTSLFWIDGAFWLPWAVAFCIFHVPAERWLGSWRWLLVGASAHILATFVSQGVLGLAIREGVRSADMIHVQVSASATSSPGWSEYSHIGSLDRGGGSTSRECSSTTAFR